jgi:tRNA(Ile)-lysidine synthase
LNAAFDRIHIENLFAALTSARGAVLAVSGGPDSMALMRLAAQWATHHAIPLFVATVDHGLREEARDEAEQVAVWATNLGLPHAILTWEGEKPTTRIQELARAARYELLRQHALRLGADHILTAHHADDQAETVLFRLLRGSGLGGLAGMQPVSSLGDLTHLRPLLACSKAALIDYCVACGQPFLQDPSNENPLFARARLRKLAPLLAEEGLDTPGLLRFAQRAARADEALTRQAASLRASLQASRSENFFFCDIRRLAEEPEELVLRILELEIRSLCPDKPLRLGRLETLTTELGSALRSGQNIRTTLGGTTIFLDHQGNLTIRREGLRRRGFKKQKGGIGASASAAASPTKNSATDGRRSAAPVAQSIGGSRSESTK